MDADPIASFKYALSGDLLVLYGLVIIGFIIRGFADFPFPVASEFLFHTVSMAVTVIGSIFVVGGVVGVIRYVCVDTLS